MRKLILALTITAGLATVPACAETIYIPEVQWSAHRGLIDYGVDKLSNWLAGTPMQTPQWEQLAPARSRKACEDTLLLHPGVQEGVALNARCRSYETQ